jgi:FG-GAP-like repeat
MQRSVALLLVVLPAPLAAPVVAQEYFPAPGFDAGLNASALALADLDGDGRPDAVTVGGSSVSVLLRSCGGFGPPTLVSIGAGTDPEDVALGDLDGDGDPDAAVSRNTGHLTGLRNDGSGGLQVVSDVHASLLPSDLALGDLDADGALDAVVTGGEDDQCFVLLGQGNCRFDAAQAFDAAGNQRALVLGDLDGDGHLDVVTGNNKVVVFLAGDGAGALAAPAAYGAGGIPWDLEAADLDGDGDLDVVVGHIAGAQELATLENLGGGSLGPPVPYAVPDASGYAVALADFDEDGWPDVAAALGGGGGTADKQMLAILLNDGSGSLATATKYTAGGTTPLRAADLDGDGHLDLAWPGGGFVSLVYGDGAGGFVDAVRQPLDNYVGEFAVGDVNGDGIADLVDQSSDSLHLGLLLGDGLGAFVPAPDIVVPVHTWFVALGELDGSPGLDLAGVSSTSLSQPEHFFALRNDGTGGFFGATTVTLPGGAWDFVLADVDGNGLQDGLIALNELDQVGLVRALGDGAFSGVVLQASGDTPRELDAGDLLEDGAADVVVASGPSGSADLRLMVADGAGALLPSVSLGLGSYGGNVVADMDGDGHQDIVVHEALTGASLLLRGDGTGAFAPPEPLGSSGYNSVSVAADINRDGAVDLVNSIGGIRYGDGDGMIAASVQHALGGTNYIFVADVDVDGDLDLLAPDGQAITILLQLDDGGPWTDLGDALSGAAGEPRLSGAGLLLPATPVVLRLQDAAALAPALLFASGVDTPLPFKGGILHAPLPLQPLLTSASGEIGLKGTWSAHIPACTTLVLQLAIADAGAPAGVALSNAIEARSP